MVVGSMLKNPNQFVFKVVNAPKIGRKSGGKSRNGCITCKARHVKCSEEKPACRKCISSGKQCADYAPQVGESSTWPSRIREASPWPNKNLQRLLNDPSSDLSLTVDTALGLPIRSIDRRYLEHFRNRSADALARLGDQELWEDLVLRLSTSRPTIQFAVLALSAQHEAFLAGGIGGLTGGSEAAMYGLHQYSQGVAALNQSLTTTSNFDLMEVMVACVLFASFEILQGNCTGAMRHGRGGLNIMSSKISKLRTQQAGDSEELSAVLNSKPVKFLIRLDVNTVAYDGVQDTYPFAVSMQGSRLSVQQPHEIPSWSSRTDSSIFENIVQAREDLYMHLACNYCFERSALPLLDNRYEFESTSFALELLSDKSSTSADTSHIPDDILHHQAVLLTNMRNWNSSLEALVRPLLAVPAEDRSMWPGGCRTKQAFIREYASIHIACIASYMSISTCLAAEEEAQGRYDGLLAEFESLLRSAEIIVQPTPETGQQHQCEWSALDMQCVIQPLAFAALKCRNHKLRKRAIFLLSISGKSGGWDGLNLALVVQRIVNYEERQAREEKRSRIGQSTLENSDEEDLEIPMCARVYRTELEIDKVNEKVIVWMRCPRDEAGVFCEVSLVNGTEWERLEKIGDLARSDHWE